MKSSHTTAFVDFHIFFEFTTFIIFLTEVDEVRCFDDALI